MNVIKHWKISAKDINDTISCVEFFNKIKEFSNFNYIKEEF